MTSVRCLVLLVGIYPTDYYLRGMRTRNAKTLETPLCAFHYFRLAAVVSHKIFLTSHARLSFSSHTSTVTTIEFCFLSQIFSTRIVATIFFPHQIKIYTVLASKKLCHHFLNTKLLVLVVHIKVIFASISCWTFEREREIITSIIILNYY